MLPLNFARKKERDERGVVLVVSMLLLLVLTVIGIAAIGTSNFDILLSSVHRQRQSVFYAAEAGLDHGRSILNADANTNKITAWTSKLAGATEDNPVVLLNNVTYGTGYQYTVTLRNNKEAGGAATDTDGVVVLRSEATATDGGRAVLELGLGLASITNTIIARSQEYTGQEGAGAGKNYNSSDLNAVDATQANGAANMQVDLTN